jgi:hypothetical protein
MKQAYLISFLEEDWQHSTAFDLSKGGAKKFSVLLVIIAWTVLSRWHDEESEVQVPCAYVIPLPNAIRLNSLRAGGLTKLVPAL